MHNRVLAHGVPSACSTAGLGRTSIYEAIRNGELRAVKRGKRTLILDDDLRQYLQSLPPMAVEQADKREKSND